MYLALSTLLHIKPGQCNIIMDECKYKYMFCSESNTSYFIMLAHYVRGDCSHMAVEVVISHQYSVMCCCHMTDGNRGQSDKMASDMKVWVK